MAAPLLFLGVWRCLGGRTTFATLAMLALPGIILRTVTALQNPVVMDPWPLNDDSHYYFSIARNLVTGHGLRHDSFNSTTGFQPLFLFVIAPVFKAVADPIEAITCVALLQVAISVGGAGALWYLMRIPAGRHAAGLMVAVWSSSSAFLGADLNGLETSLALYTTCLAIGYYFARFGGDGGAPARSSYLVLGLLCGVAFLARVDAVFLLPVLVVGLVGHRGASDGGIRRTVPLFWFGVGAGVLITPWLAFNVFMTGHALPISGRAVRFLSQAYGFRMIENGVNQTPRYFPIGHPPWLYYLETIKRGIAVLVTLNQQVLSLRAGAIVVAAALVSSPVGFLRSMLTVRVVFLYAACLFAAYVLYIFGQWQFGRYFLPISLLYGLALTVSARHLSDRWLPRRRPMALLAHTATAILLTAALTSSLTTSTRQVLQLTHHTQPSGRHLVAQWLNQHTEPTALIGSFQSGIVGYYLERRFVALDGKVNDAALGAMQSNSMDAYIVAQKIDYLVDWRWVLQDLLVRRSQNENVLRERRVVWVEETPEETSDIYKVSPPK